jgi:hypothetical protein
LQITGLGYERGTYGIKFYNVSQIFWVLGIRALPGIRGGFKQAAEFLISRYLTIIWKTSNLAASTAGDNFDEVKIGRAA